MPSQNFEDIIQKIRKRESFAPVYKTIVLNLATAASEEVVNIAGGYFQIIDATDTLANIQIKFNENSHDQITLRKGDAVITPFYKTLLSWTAQAGKTVTIAISADFDLWRIDRSAQIISTIDSVTSITNPVTVQTAAGVPVASKDWIIDRAINAQHFATGRVVAAVAGNYTQLQIWNPAGSGKTVVVLDALVDSGLTAASGNHFEVTIGTVALANLIFQIPSTSVGSPAGGSQVRYENPAALIGSSIGTIGMPSVAYVPVEIPHINAVLGEGEGLSLGPNQVNVNFRARVRVVEF